MCLSGAGTASASPGAQRPQMQPGAVPGGASGYSTASCTTSQCVSVLGFLIIFLPLVRLFLSTTGRAELIQGNNQSSVYFKILKFAQKVHYSLNRRSSDPFHRISVSRSITVVPNWAGNFPLGGNFGLPGGNSGHA